MIGIRVLERNYLEVYTYQQWSTNELPHFSVGERIVPFSLKMSNGKTCGPSLLTESDLISIMDANGIGTDATIHEHINKILEREYIFKKSNGGLEPSNLGIALVEGYDGIGFEISLTKPFLRAKMEAEMILISQGQRSKQQVVQSNLAMYRDVFFKIVATFGTLDSAILKYCNEEVSIIPTPSTARSSAKSEVIQDDSSPLCQCQEGSVLKTVSKDGPNQGRKFYTCAQEVRCQFFQWLEENNNSNAGRPMESFRPANSYFSPPASASSDERKCQCGLISQRLLCKNGQNSGRYFFKCIKQSGKCSFFEWEGDEEGGKENAPLSTSFSINNLTCFKCNQVGHLASSCSNSTTFQAKKSGRGSGSRKRKLM